MKIIDNLDEFLYLVARNKCPSALMIDLDHNDLGAKDAKLIATALQSGKCPNGLTISLKYNLLDVEGAQHIATALQSGNCPSGLTIDLTFNNLGANGAKHIATALQSEKCPSGLTINLESNTLGAEGIQHIATALQSGKCPCRLTINLGSNNFDVEGTKHITTALQSGNCPNELTIDLVNNNLGTEGAKYIATTLQSGNCPSGLTINLGYNAFDTEGVISLAQGMMHNNTPVDLCLVFTPYYGSATSLTRVQTTLLGYALLTSPHHIDKGLRLKGLPEVNLALQKLLQNEAGGTDNATENPQNCKSDPIATKLAHLTNLYNSLETLFPGEEILSETSLALLKSFSIFLTQYGPAYKSDADAATVKTHYQYLDESLLPIIINWHKKLSQQSKVSAAHRQQFIDGCDYLANLYNTPFANDILFKEDKTNGQDADRQIAQQALAMRTKLYQLAHRYRKESTLYPITLLGLADSLAGKGLTLLGIGNAHDKLQDHSHALVAYQCMNDVWRAREADVSLSSAANAATPVIKPVPSSDNSAAPLLSTTTTHSSTSHSSTSSTSSTAGASSKIIHAPQAHGIFNQPNPNAKDNATLATKATSSHSEPLTTPQASNSTLASSAAKPSGRQS